MEFGTVFVGSIRNHPLAVADELGLPDHAVATFGLAIGRPDLTEPAGIKPRLPQAAVLHHETYDAESADSHVEAYDEVLSGYNVGTASRETGAQRFSLVSPMPSRYMAGSDCVRSSRHAGCRRGDRVRLTQPTTLIAPPNPTGRHRQAPATQ
ncbi:hypothetical protein [Gordonia sp. AC31]|uniref:hypothetical protein n=1 Tax=Gordonia sp. AC31 TaxID=2962571 RepID=UPI002248D112|nr:hypothetical protein [Gordonia sp. AC31]MCX2756627.1 hypothetical protein [Gordonia sp. 4N]MDT0222723.1 hypothetical protein [Gordonia sp. AC31]